MSLLSAALASLLVREDVAPVEDRQLSAGAEITNRLDDIATQPERLEATPARCTPATDAGRASDPTTVPANQFGLYYTDTNAPDVTVEVSATDTAVQSLTVAKDADGAETAD